MRLYDFAYVPNLNGILERIAQLAIQENWGESHSFLRDYCFTNFDLASEQGLIWEDPDKRFAIWRIGTLVTNQGMSLYGYFVRNELENRQDYVLKTVFPSWPNNLVIRYQPSWNSREERIVIPDPLSAPSYGPPPYQGHYAIDINWGHILLEHPSRLRELLSGLSGRPLELCIFGSVQYSHRLAERLSVPQYYDGRYQWLLPLYITHENYNKSPDLVAPLDSEDYPNTYVVKTVLAPAWAYSKARAIAVNTTQLAPWLDGAAGNPETVTVNGSSAV